MRRQLNAERDATRSAATSSGHVEHAVLPAEVRWPWARIETDQGAVLRRIDAVDATGVLQVHGDPRVYVHDPNETHPGLAHTQAFLAPMITHWREHGFGYWTLLVPAATWPDGTASHQAEDAGRRIAGLGGVQHHTMAGRPVLNVYFRFAPEVQGRGLAGTVLDCASMTARHVAPDLDIVVRTRPGNGAARRVAERAGYVDEGLESGDPTMRVLRLRAT